MGVAPPPAVPTGVLGAHPVRPALARARRAAAGRPASCRSACAGRASSSSEPLPLLLELHERYGPVFTMRLLYLPVVFALGPEANHYITVSHASNFRWRDGSMGDLIPLLGDGLLTTDGDYHRRARRIMLPAFHREQLAASTSIMVEETERALAELAARARGSTCTPGRAGWRCGSRCGRCSASTPTAADATPRWPRSSRRRSATGARTTCCRCCAARARPGGR